MKENANGKPARRPSPAEDPPLPEGLAERIGTAKDAALGREFGVLPRLIRDYRILHGIPAYRINWTPEMDALVRGNLPNTECAEILGIEREDVANRRHQFGIPVPEPTGNWTPEIDARLGTVLDAVLARELGLTPAAVSTRRRLLGIPRYRRPPKPGRRGPRQINVTVALPPAQRAAILEECAARGIPFAAWIREACGEKLGGSQGSRVRSQRSEDGGQ